MSPKSKLSGPKKLRKKVKIKSESAESKSDNVKIVTKRTMRLLEQLLNDKTVVVKTTADADILPAENYVYG